MRARQEFLVGQLFHVALLLLYRDNVSALTLFASGAANVLMYGRLIWQELCLSDTPLHPFVLFLTSGCLRVGVASCWAALAYGMGHSEPVKFGPTRVDDFLICGQASLTAGDWFFILAFTLCNPRWSSQPVKSSFVASTRLTNLAIGLLIFGWVLKALIIAGVPLLKLGHVAAVFVNFSSLAAIYLIFINAGATRQKSGPGYYWLLGGIVSVEFVLALSSYMKSDALNLIVALALCGFHEALVRRRQGREILSPFQWTAALAGLVFVVFVLFPYSQLRRSDFWVNGQPRDDVEVLPYLKKALDAAIPGTDAFAEMHEFPSLGAWSFLARHADITAASWCFEYVYHYGTVHGMFMQDALTNMVPRIVWQGKPQYYPGRKIAVMLGSARDVETATTSIGVGGIAPSLYLNFGLPALVAGCLLNGIAFSLFSGIFTRDADANPIATVLYIALSQAAVTHFEGVLDGGLVLYAYYLLVFLPLLQISKWMFGRNVRPSETRQRRGAVKCTSRTSGQPNA